MPFTFRIDPKNEIIPNPDSHIIRRLSSLENQYLDKNKYEEMIKKEDVVLYEGHFHSVSETAELYFCLKGQ